MFPYLPGGLDDFVDRVVPELQRRESSGANTRARPCARTSASSGRQTGISRIRNTVARMMLALRATVRAQSMTIGRDAHARPPSSVSLGVIPLGAAIAPAHSGQAQTGDSAPSTESTMVSDIDPQSRFRLPLPKRENLDEVGKRMYDRATTPGATIAGLQGPAGIQLYATKAAEHLQPLNHYLRFQSGISPRIREVAILITAREMDSQFEWVAHEPEARRKAFRKKSSMPSSTARAPKGWTRATRSSSNSAARSGATTR
jgi:hypothetical protein